MTMRRVTLLLASFFVLLPLAASAQAPLPWKVTFNASPDHSATDQGGAAVIARYELVVSQDGKAVKTVDLAKPAPDTNQLITVDVNTALVPLPTGTYVAVVQAVGPGGTGTSQPSAPFTLTVRAPGSWSSTTTVSRK
jgi:hypothetical protein